MSTRWFFTAARVGIGPAAPGGQGLTTEVTFRREVDGRPPEPVRTPGPTLTPVGPGDVIGFDRSMVLREEPPPGATPAAENILAGIELAHADLPWLLSPGPVATPSGPSPLPWIVLVVLSEDEAAPPRDGNPLPVLTVPVAALPPLAQRWAWAHVEARLDDAVTDAASATVLASAAVRSSSAGVVARLLCPRRLAPDRGWIAAVVPATNAGVATGLGRAPVGPPGADAWPHGDATIELPVYHWWRFRTGQAGTFEELARRLSFRSADDAGLGTRTVDVEHPWGAEPPGGPATVALDGALRVPGTAGPETWSDQAAQQSFERVLRERLDAPAARRDPPSGDPGAAPATPGALAGPGETEADRDTSAVGPPLYGSHHTGRQTVPEEPDAWISTLNLEVRRRVAAALGTRYVQLEQEFLMARAWEQVGEIREANRLLATTELAAAAAERAQRKHLDPLGTPDLLAVMAPVGNRIALTTAVTTPTTLTTALSASPRLSGTVSTAFARLTRRGGALSRRAGRVGAVETADGIGSVIGQGLRTLAGATGPDPALLPGDVREALSPLRLQMLRMADRILTLGATPDDVRPLRPIMRHPRFDVPIAEEILTRWPEWAIPGIGALPTDTVTLLETNPAFVAAVLVGSNHELNRELLWREFPTDQRGTAFARFWPDGPDVDEIARWPEADPLGSQPGTGGEGTLALLVRGELLLRFPGTALLAVRGENGELPAAFAGLAGTPLPLDASTTLYLLEGLDAAQARAEDWFFVFREPMHATQFGFDTGPQPEAMDTWADLTWAGVPTDSGFVQLSPPPAPPRNLPPGDAPVWGRDAADQARIAYQQPFQLAFRAATLLGP